MLSLLLWNNLTNIPLHQVGELRRQEGMDPPIPGHVLETLQAAEADLRLLVFKYSVLAAAVAKRPTAPATEGEADGGVGGGGGGLCGEDLLGLLDQHVRSQLSPLQNRIHVYINTWS